MVCLNIPRYNDNVPHSTTYECGLIYFKHFFDLVRFKNYINSNELGQSLVSIVCFSVTL